MIALGNHLGREKRIDILTAHHRHEGLLPENKHKPLAQTARRNTP
jgi:hypothetical protein